jgi:hypothetical protein
MNRFCESLMLCLAELHDSLTASPAFVSAVVIIIVLFFLE